MEYLYGIIQSLEFNLFFFLLIYLYGVSLYVNLFHVLIYEAVDLNWILILKCLCIHIFVDITGSIWIFNNYYDIHI